jgi:endonuclease/exonuclease/phosphatase family metal-dependent hydrolase
MKQFIRIIGFFFKALSALAAVALLLSYLSIYINPEKIWIPAFFGLFFIPLLLINLLLSISWIIVRSKAAWINFISIAPAIFYLPSFIQFGNSSLSPPLNEKDNIKILTYNVHLFGLLGSEKQAKTLNDISSFVKRENPDILCIQELSEFDTLNINKAFRQYPYHHYNLTQRRNGAFFGIATFSYHPVIESGDFKFSGTGNSCIFTDITIKEKTIRVYNNHLQSVNINLERSALRVRQEELRNAEIKYVSDRLRTGFIKRAQQVDLITEHISTSPYPIIVCGDFNDTPISYTYRKMKGNRNDSFIKAGSGMSSTYQSLWPAFRIDYVFADKELTVVDYKMAKICYSDHYPVIVKLNLPQ